MTAGPRTDGPPTDGPPTDGPRTATAAATAAADGAEELRLLRETVRQALDDLSSPARVRALMETEQGWDQVTWLRLCGELGLAGLAVPEEYGGSGFTCVELGIVFEEAGRSLLCAPLLATSGLAIPLLLALGDDAACRRYLPALCEGSLTATVVTADEAGRTLPDGTFVRAVHQDGAWTLHGAAGFVVDGATAGLLLVPALLCAGDRTEGPAGAGAATAERIGIFAVETARAPAAAGAAPAGLTVEPLVTLDPTRRQARLVFAGVPAAPLGSGAVAAESDATGAPAATGVPEASGALLRALDVARALLACEQAAGAARCLELTVEYVKSRVQFGRPIGGFQAIKQRTADLLIKVESARSAAIAAAQAAADDLAAIGACGPPGVRNLPDLPALPIVAAVARSYCSEAYVAVAADMIQLHGGIGFTWEHDAHLYYKRAWTSAQLLGGADDDIERLAEYLTAAAAI